MKKIFRKMYNFIKEISKNSEKSMQNYLEDVPIKDKELRLKYMLEDWVKEAEVILSKFIEKNPGKIDGFTFYQYYNVSDDPGFLGYATIKRLSDGKFCIEERSFYGGLDSEPVEVDYDYNIKKIGYIPKSLANRLLDPKRTGMQTYSGHFVNKNRNEFLKKIEEKTGLNLKREIKNLRKKGSQK